MREDGGEWGAGLILGIFSFISHQRNKHHFGEANFHHQQAIMLNVSSVVLSPFLVEIVR